MQLSYSKLQTFRQCPLRYRFTYLDRLPRRPRRLFRAGRRVHAALMRWLTYARKGMPVWDEVEAAYAAAWDAAESPELRATREYEEGLEILKSFHESNAGTSCNPVMLEQKFRFALGPHVVCGAIDRVERAAWGEIGGSGELGRAPFASPIVDFYQTNPIARASAVMAECSRVFGGGRELGATGTHG